MRTLTLVVWLSLPPFALIGLGQVLALLPPPLALLSAVVVSGLVGAYRWYDLIHPGVQPPASVRRSGDGG
jgi:hypothetical protein